MTSKIKLTADRVAKLECEAGKAQAFYRDTETPALGVKVTSSGGRSYVFETRASFGAVRIKIGDCSTWTLKDAKKRATELKALTDRGIDPREVEKDKVHALKAKKLEAQLKEKTVAQAWEAYVNHLKTATKKNGAALSERHIADHIALASLGGETSLRSKQPKKAGALAALMPLKMKDLSSETIAKWLAKENATRKTQAALAYRLFKAFLRWCDEEPAYKGLVSPAILEAKKVQRNVTTTATKEGDYVRLTDLAAWFKGVNQLSNQSVRAYLIGMMLTGARPNEWLGLRWEDVNLPRHEAEIRDKNKGRRTIPLPPYLSSLLAALPRTAGNPWVFSSDAGNSKSGRIAAVRDPHIAALQSQGLPHSSLHGLRRSFITVANRTAPAGVSHRIVGHSLKTVQDKHYEQIEPHELLEWHTIIERKILDLASIEFSQEAQPIGLRAIGSGK